ncbi:hypothetical protein HDU79_011889 [Rhizoclosmatium sp. JEL0117]|nr:hypothetical protein HDU79_011889 [Rhizoclosmatium sp. JEL0117]
MNLALLAAALLPLTNAQALFKGDTCNLNIPSFNGPNANLPTSGKVDYVNGALVMTMLPPSNPSDPTAPGASVIGTTPLSLLYGTVEAVIQQSTIGGAVTYLTLINQNTADEIDFEWIGNERNTVWTNFFYRGLRERETVSQNEVWSSQVSTGSDDNSQTTHTYRIDWTPDAITWSIDGNVVRTQAKANTYEAAGKGDGLPYDHYHYPNTPLTVNVGIWNYQGPLWANGPIDWTQPSAQKGFTAKVLSLKVSCYQGNIPVMTDPTVVPKQSDIYHDGFQTIAPPAGDGPAVVATTTTAGVLVPGSTSGVSGTTAAITGGASTATVLQPVGSATTAANGAAVASKTGAITTKVGSNGVKNIAVGILGATIFGMLVL